MSLGLDPHLSQTKGQPFNGSPILFVSYFVFALSNSSLGSKPCLAELAYARDLGLPILPVQVGSVNNLRTAPISEIQIIDYRERTAGSVRVPIAAQIGDRGSSTLPGGAERPRR